MTRRSGLGAMIGAIAMAAKTTGTLDAAALADLPWELADQLRAARAGGRVWVRSGRSSPLAAASGAGHKPDEAPPRAAALSSS
jgi:hypothetical protein